MENKLKIQSATTTSNPYLVAVTSERILDMKREDALDMIHSLIVKAFHDTGTMFKQDERTLIITTYDEIKTYFPYLKSGELRMAFASGVRKEYGEYFGINLVTFNQWIKGWMKDEKRMNAKKELLKDKEYPPVMTISEAEYAWKEAITRQFKEFKKTGHLVCEFPNHLFKHLEQIGLICISNAQKFEIRNKAIESIIQSKKIARLNPKSKLHLFQLSDQIKRIEEDKMTKEDMAEVKQMARLMSIKNYYSSIEELKL